ncbi:MAG: NIPSNAP family protein [Acidobacteriota bacterium]|nr:NIPSNAP family protein [Acidobacteriota bacterium]
MERRDFLTASLAASALALTHQSEAQTPAAQTPANAQREYYEIRKYHLQNGPQNKLTDAYLASALIPALNRLGIGPIGAFHLDIGPETPTLYLLMPSSNLETLATAQHHLAHDEKFMQAAEPFWNAPATAPPFQRVESSLHIAFEGHPKLTLPASTASHAKRIFQLRTYESPSPAAHVRKVEMFHHGEFEIFQNAGCNPVFYSDTLIGPRMPNLTYMLSFTDLADLTARWSAFAADPAWIKLKSSPRYAYEEIVSNITNLILSPTPYSQI